LPRLNKVLVVDQNSGNTGTNRTASQQADVNFFHNAVTFLLEAISKMSFGPMSLLVPRFKSSKYSSMPAVCDPQRE
jgi:hypothetical protein